MVCCKACGIRNNSYYREKKKPQKTKSCCTINTFRKSEEKTNKEQIRSSQCIIDIVENISATKCLSVTSICTPRFFICQC